MAKKAAAPALLAGAVSFIDTRQWQPCPAADKDAWRGASPELVLIKVPADFEDLSLLASAELLPEPSSLVVLAQVNGEMRNFGTPARAFRLAPEPLPSAPRAITRLTKRPLVPPKRRMNHIDSSQSSQDQGADVAVDRPVKHRKKDKKKEKLK